MTSAFKFDAKSVKEIATVHPQLQALCHRALAISTVDFKILQGIRTAAEQLKAFNGGFSKIKSGGRHQFGCAIDFMVIDPSTGKATFEKPMLYAKVREAFRTAAGGEGIPIRTLEHIGDLGHVELPKSYMPDNWKSKPTKYPVPVQPPVVVAPVVPPVPQYAPIALKEVQTRLLGHGYVKVGGIDGILGDNTKGAIRDFRASNGLPVNEDIDDALMAALKNPSAVRPVIAPERAEATVSDLRAKGSAIITASDVQKVGTVVVAGGTAVKPIIDILTDSGKQVQEVTEALTPFQSFMAFFSEGAWVNWIWVPILVIALIVGWQAVRIARARLKDHVTGNTSVVNLPAVTERSP